MNLTETIPPFVYPISSAQPNTKPGIKTKDTNPGPPSPSSASEYSLTVALGRSHSKLRALRDLGV